MEILRERSAMASQQMTAAFFTDMVCNPLKGLEAWQSLMAKR